jgi:hypothetical protein
MMKFTKKAGVAAAISAILGTSAHAAVYNASASFRTIADVTITEVTALGYGTSIFGKAATNCILTAAIANTTSTATAVLTGTGCNTSTEAAGVYSIAGVAGSTVTVLMASVVDPDFTFAPAGVFNDQEGTTDVITPYFADSAINIVLEAGGATGLLAVGGELNILNDLTASTSYSIAYDISVIY